MTFLVGKKEPYMKRYRTI